MHVPAVMVDATKKKYAKNLNSDSSPLSASTEHNKKGFVQNQLLSEKF